MSGGIENETFVIHNADGSVSLDAYAGMTREELKAQCSVLCMALNEWQFIAMNLFENGKDRLPQQSRQKVERLIEAYSD